DPTPLGKGEWLSRERAADRIGQLRLQPANAPVSARVGAALELLARLGATRDDGQRWKRARLLGVFSDRTPASWDVRDRKSLQTLANQVPPTFERLAAVQAGLPELERLVGNLPQRLPAVGQAFAGAALVDASKRLGERLAQLQADDYPDTATQPLLA